MARTVFALTRDGESSSFPDEAGYPTASTTSGQNLQRYGASPVESISFPKNTDGNDHFKTPMIKFVILDAYGGRVPNAPFIYLKAPNNLNLSNINNYQTDGPIFGAGTTTGSDIYNSLLGEAEADFRSSGSDAGTFAFGAAQALEYSIKKGAASLAGFTSSAGLNNVGQFEFLSRRALNPMQQQLFKGPNFRRYQLPFAMKPRNRDDAVDIKRAVTAFRLASSASVPLGEELFEGTDFTFGYPHLVQFAVLADNAADNRKVFQSKACVIESVSVDYGSQKMAFHGGNFPVETNLALSLIEIVPRTLGDAINDSNRPGQTLQ